MIECQFLHNSRCEIASEIANVDVPTTEKACIICLGQSTRINHVTASLALSKLPKPLSEDKKYLQTLLKTEPVTVLQNGPGTELKKLISWFYSPTKKCKCDTRIQKMNSWGPDKCEQNMDTILRWLQHSASIAKVPYLEIAARMMVAKAIRKSRK